MKIQLSWISQEGDAHLFWSGSRVWVNREVNSGFLNCPKGGEAFRCHRGVKFTLHSGMLISRYCGGGCAWQMNRKQAWDRFKWPFRDSLLWWLKKSLCSCVHVPGILLDPVQGKCWWWAYGSFSLESAQLLHPLIQSWCLSCCTSSPSKILSLVFTLELYTLEHLSALGTRLMLHLFNPVVPWWLLGKCSPSRPCTHGPFQSQKWSVIFQKSGNLWRRKFFEMNGLNFRKSKGSK